MEPPPPPYGQPYGQQPPYRPPQPPAARSGNGKIIGIVAGVLAGVLVLCGGTAVVGFLVADRAGVFDDNAGPDDPGGEVPETGPVTWLSMQRDTPAMDNLWADLASDFAVANDAEVDVVAAPRDAFLPMLDSRFEARDIPDLFDSPGGYRLREQVERGMVRDLTDELADVIATLSPSTLAPYTVDGRVYGLPYHTAVTGFWFNRALFADAGLDPDRPPQTWDDFLTAVEALKEAGITPVAIGGLDPWTVLYWYGCLATRTAGVDAFVAATEQRSLSANPDYLRAAELLDLFIRNEPFQQGYETAGWAAPGGPVELVGSGQAAMELMGSWAPGLYHTLGDGGLGDNLGWFPFPTVEGGSGSAADIYGTTDGFAVGATAPGTAIDLLRFLFGGASYQRIIDADPSLLPALASAEPPADPHLAAPLAALRDAQAMQAAFDFDLPPEVSTELTNVLTRLLVEDATPDEVVTQPTDLWQTISD
jgi:raffinose/stachyose/melibiose transport system substrate-binding protein